MTNVLLYRGHGACAGIVLQWRSSGSCCSTDAHANRRPRCSVYIHPHMRLIRSSMPAYNTCDQLTRPCCLTTPWTICPSALSAGSDICADLRWDGQLTRPPPRPTLPPAPVYSAAVDSPVINFTADYFRSRHIRCYPSYMFY